MVDYNVYKWWSNGNLHIIILSCQHVNKAVGEIFLLFERTNICLKSLEANWREKVIITSLVNYRGRQTYCHVYCHPRAQFNVLRLPC